MERITFSIIDYLFFAVMLGLNCAIGLYFGFYKKSKTPDDYFFGGRNMATFPITFSLVAGTISPLSLVALPAEIYRFGTQVSLLLVSILIAGLLNHYIYLPMFYNLKLNSVYDYLELRFDKHVKSIAFLIYVLTKFFLLSLLMYAPSLSLNQVTGFNLHGIAWILACICIFYTTMGGLKAVCWTDAIQFFVAFGATLYVLIKGIVLVGGGQELWQKAYNGQRIEFFNMNPDPTIRSTFWSVAIGNSFLWLDHLAINPSTVQRSVSLPSLENAKRANMVTITFAMLSKLLCCFLGIVTFAKYSGCDPYSLGLIKKMDQIFTYFVMDIGSSVSGFTGLYVAALCTMTLCALSTILNSISAILYFDFLVHVLPENGLLVNNSGTVVKIMTAVVGIAGVFFIFIIEKMGSLFELVHSVPGIMDGPLLGAFTLGLLVPMANKKGALVSVLSSLVIMSYLVIQRQVYVWEGAIPSTTKPLSTSECNVTSLNGSLVTEIRSTSEMPLWLFRLSFHYYTCIGAVLTIVIGVIVSALTSDDTAVEANLVVPCVRHFISSKRSRKAETEENTYLYNISKKNESN